MLLFNKKGILLFLITAAVWVAGSGVDVYAEDETFSKETSLEKILENVTETHPEIIEARARYRSVRGERSIATSGHLPRVGAELSLGQEVTEGVDTNDRRENLTASTATLYARQNLFNGWKTTAFIHETDARILAAAYETLNVANTVYLATVESYIQVLQARKMLELAQDNMLTQEKILEQVREKAKSGFNRISDLKNSESRFALSRSNFISRQQDLNQSVVKFHRQFGRFIKAEDFIMPKPAFMVPGSVEETVDIAFDNHPALDVASYNIQVRKFGYEKAEADDWPSLDLELKAQRASNTGGDEGETDQFSAMLKLGYVFFDGGIRKGEKARAYEFLHKENQRAYVERRNVNESVRLAWNIFQAEIRKKKYLAEYVDLSAQTLAAFKDEYHIGRRTLLDLLNMENEYNSARNSQAESDFSYLTAYYRLSQAMGLLLREFDPGLRKAMALPEKKELDLKGYEELDHNRDEDSMEDPWDQCDNSVKGTDTPCAGCGENQPVVLGYKEPERVGPYIKPEKEMPKPVALPKPVPVEKVAAREDKPIPKELVLKIDNGKAVQSISLDVIHFKSASDVLTKDSVVKLTYIADQLIKAKGFNIEVIGHTDYTGSGEYNMRLSKARAKRVYTELIRLGVEKERLSWSGKGEFEPVATNKTEKGKSRNRRTEFKLTKRKQSD